MYIGPWQEFQLAQEGNRPSAPSAPVLDNVRKILEDAASCGDFDPEAVAKLGLLLAAGSNQKKPLQRPDSASSRASISSRSSSFSNASSQRSRVSNADSSRGSVRGKSTQGTWAHKGVRMPPRDRIVNGIRIRTGGSGQECGDRSAAESVALRVQSVDSSSPSWSLPQTARSENNLGGHQTSRSSRSSRRSHVSAPVMSRSQALRKEQEEGTPKKKSGSRERRRNERQDDAQKDDEEEGETYDSKKVASLLKAERRNRFHTQRQDLNNLWGEKWKDKQPKQSAKKAEEASINSVNAMRAIYLDALNGEAQHPPLAVDTSEGGGGGGEDTRSAKNSNSLSSQPAPIDQKNHRSSIVADMKLTNDHIDLVAKYFEDDALQLLTDTIEPSPRPPPLSTPNVRSSLLQSPTMRNSSSGGSLQSGRTSPIRVQPPSPLSIRQHSREDFNALRMSAGGTPSSKLGTPKTGDSRYQSVDALLDWAKDLNVDDDFLNQF